MRQSRSTLVLAALLALGAGGAWASTPDGQTPAVETVCDSEVGAAFGLCNAYCEAMDCDSPFHQASDRACQSVRENFTERTGRDVPCETTCPCVGDLAIFTAVVEGTESISRCLIVNGVDVLVTDEAENVLTSVVTMPSPRCVDFGGEFRELTEAERLICAVTLRTAAEVTQQVPCEVPE